MSDQKPFLTGNFQSELRQQNYLQLCAGEKGKGSMREGGGGGVKVGE